MPQSPAENSKTKSTFAGSPESMRLSFLDALRGIAAIYVVLFHVAVASQPRIPVSPWFMPIAEFGLTGVHLFFIISGFSLSLTMQRHARTGNPLLSYYGSRFFRIAPLFYALLLFAFPRDLLASSFMNTPSNLILNASLLFNLAPHHQEGMVWASWTVSVEVIYYMMFPVLYRLPNLAKIAFMFLSALLYVGLLQFPVSADPFNYFIFVGYIPFFIAGELAFQGFSTLAKRSDAREIGRFLTVAGFAVLVTDVWLIPQSSVILFRVASGVGYSAVLIGMGLAPIRWIVNPITKFFGRISYSFYLCHMLIMFALSPVYAAISRSLPTNAVYPACLALTFGGTTLLAMVTFKLIEKQGILLGKKLLRARNVYGTPQQISPTAAG